MAKKMSREAMATMAMRDQGWADLRESASIMEHLMQTIMPGLHQAVGEGHNQITLVLDPEQLAVILQSMAVCHGELCMREEGLVV